MRFTESHEWIFLEKDVGTVGVTSFAQNELGEIVSIEFPKIGSKVEKGQEICVLESNKAAADMYSPVSGIIIEVNETVQKENETINRLAEKEGWLFKIQLNNPQEYYDLLTLEKYNKLTVV